MIHCYNPPDSLIDAAAGVARESVVEVPDEKVFVLIIQCHEGPAHHNVLHLVHRVTQLLQLQGQGHTSVKATQAIREVKDTYGPHKGSS